MELNTRSHFLLFIDWRIIFILLIPTLNGGGGGGAVFLLLFILNRRRRVVEWNRIEPNRKARRIKPPSHRHTDRRIDSIIISSFFFCLVLSFCNNYLKKNKKGGRRGFFFPINLMLKGEGFDLFVASRSVALLS